MHDKFVYAGKEIPPYGDYGQVLVKTSKAFYYTAWSDIDHIINDTNAEIDEGEYTQLQNEAMLMPPFWLGFHCYGFHS